MDDRMNDNKETIVDSEAEYALETLSKIERDTNTYVRPPLWLTFIIACFYGMMTFSWASARHENLWMLGLIASTIGFLLALAFYLYSSRLLGAKPKLLPRDKSELIFQTVTAFLFALVFLLTRYFSTEGIWWSSYVGGTINTLLLAYLLHNYSTGKFIARINRDE